MIRESYLTEKAEKLAASARGMPGPLLQGRVYTARKTDGKGLFFKRDRNRMQGPKGPVLVVLDT
jgi:hypothetical protein